MASIQTGIELNDHFSSVLNGIISSVNLAISAIDEMQQSLNADVDTSSIEGARDGINQATAAYRQLQQAAGKIDDYIRDDTDEQKKFNETIKSGTSQADKLMSTIKSAVTAYASIQTVKEVIGIADDLTAVTARLNMMNESFNEINGTALETSELVNKVYAAAQDSGGSFSDMAAVVARIGNNAKDAFSSQDEVVAFATLVQKQMSATGVKTEEAAAATLQLSQALASGVLRGDELNSIYEEAPALIEDIQKYLEEVGGIDASDIRELASEGEITADIVKNAMFYCADEINSEFESMPKTWETQWQSFKDAALFAFQPVLQRISDMANSEEFQTFISNAEGLMVTLSNIVLGIFDMIGQIGSFIAANWSVISPGVYAAAAALAVYAAYLAVTKAAALASAAAQWVYNAAMSASPVARIAILILALIATFYAAVAAVNNFAGTSVSATGLIGAAFAVLGAHVINTFVVPMYNTLASLANFIGNVMNDPIAAIKVLFYDMCLTVIGYFQNLASAIETLLNKIPGVTVDITSGLDSFYEGLEQAQQEVKDESGWVEYVQKMDYIDYSGAASAGYDFGESAASTVSDAISGLFDTGELPDTESYMEEVNSSIADAGISDSLGSIAEDTGNISDSMDITEEELKYMRDIAEQEAVNRFTTAEISVDMSGMSNNINNGMDLDGVVSGLTDAVNEAIETMAEGVHD